MTASRSSGIIVLNERSMQVVFALEHPELSIPAGNCKFTISPDGKYVAIGSSNGSLFLFDIKIGEFIEAYED